MTLVVSVIDPIVATMAFEYMPGIVPAVKSPVEEIVPADALAGATLHSTFGVGT